MIRLERDYEIIEPGRDFMLNTHGAHTARHQAAR